MTVFYNFLNSNSGTFPVFPALEKIDGKDFGQNTMTFQHNIAYKVNAFVFHNM